MQALRTATENIINLFALLCQQLWTALRVLGLTKGGKQCIRDRSSTMAQHFFVDKMSCDASNLFSLLAMTWWSPHKLLPLDMVGDSFLDTEACLTSLLQVVALLSSLNIYI
ncbi:hypothetical protein Droror1_Dr00015666 [Drosera rotundifolia]